MFFQQCALFIGMALVVVPLIASAEAPLVPPPAPTVQNQSSPSVTAFDAVREDESDGLADERPFYIPLILNESVENQIEYFTTQGRKVFQHWLDHSARYIVMMKKIFREYNLPEDLVYVAMIESGFNTRAVSPKKAVGPWQFMHGTGRDYGLSIDHWVDERKDPVKSTHAAAAFFKDLYNLFGSWPLAIASYNAGSGTVKAALMRARSGDFWDLIGSPHIRGETSTYVPRYMAAMVIAKNPVAYGFMVPGVEPFEFDEIIVKKSTSIREIARNAQCTCEEILELNPELIRGLTPPGKYYVLRLPAGTGSVYESQLAKNRHQEKLREARRKAVRNAVLLSRLAPHSREKNQKTASPEKIVPRFGIQFGSIGNDFYKE